MDMNEKQQLVQSMKASVPRQAQPTISREELDRYPCSVRPVEVPVEGEPPCGGLSHRALAGTPRGAHDGELPRRRLYPGPQRPGRAVLPPSGLHLPVRGGRRGLRPGPRAPLPHGGPSGPGRRPVGQGARRRAGLRPGEGAAHRPERGRQPGGQRVHGGEGESPGQPPVRRDGLFPPGYADRPGGKVPSRARYGPSAGPELQRPVLRSRAGGRSPGVPPLCRPGAAHRLPAHPGHHRRGRQSGP